MWIRGLERERERESERDEDRWGGGEEVHGCVLNNFENVLDYYFQSVSECVLMVV